MRAAAAGGLWASVEVITGSFLHNLRIPMAGTLLGAFGIALLVGFSAFWKQKDFIWRAGLICALMKSVSSSSIILGPMIGILSEAFLLWAAVTILGLNPLGYLAGGALSLLGVLCQKILFLLLSYGSNLIGLYESMYTYASKQLGTVGSEPLDLIRLLALLYVLAGILSSATGLFIGQRSKNRKTDTDITAVVHEEGYPTGDHLVMAPEGRPALGYLFLHLFALIAGIVLINKLTILQSFLVILCYTMACFLLYKGLGRRLMKPVFWIQLLVVTLLAGLFSGNGQSPYYLGTPGLVSGLEMSLRAILVVVAFFSLSIELRNPLIRAFLTRHGSGRLYAALEVSFGILPVFFSLLPKARRLLLHPVRSLSGMIVRADCWLASGGREHTAGDPAGTS
jgi:hypothetical protein